MFSRARFLHRFEGTIAEAHKARSSSWRTTLGQALFIVIVAGTSSWYGYALGREQARRTLEVEIARLRNALHSMENSASKESATERRL
ncbi:hypothetical protein CCYA_CCYA20G4805 [Cyanidiococcus yangmingshanensis]|nr:hypothetical protein CCYA_CCYA20G4805 [Cyanidiococcus yangmingshanensis]